MREMSIFGDKNRFALEIRLSPDSDVDIARAFGSYRIWVAGIPYGRNDDDATCFAASFDTLARRIAARPVEGTPLLGIGRAMFAKQILQTVYDVTYVVLPTNSQGERL